MLKGDLATSSLEAVLTGLADDQATGCLHVSDPDGEEALVYFKNGLVYAVSVPGRRPQLGARLISSGALAPEGLAEALEAQRDELQGWRLGELLVHLGYVDREVVEAFVAEALRDAMTDLMRWHVGRWKFRKNVRTREDVAPPALVSALLGDVRERVEQWHEISETVHGPNAVPHLSTRTDSAAEMTLDPDAWSLLCKVDGERSVAELARDCGFTLLEAGRVVLVLVQAGLVDVEEDLPTAQTAPPAPVVPEQAGPTDDVDPAAIARSLAAAFADDQPSEPAPDGAGDPASELSALAESTSGMLRHPHSGDEFSDSIARVSQALSELLGPSAATAGGTEALFEVPEHLRVGHGRTVATPQHTGPTEDDERRERVRAAAAEELARAHASAEEERREQEERAKPSSADEAVATHPETDASTEPTPVPEPTGEPEAETPSEEGPAAEVAPVVSLSRRRRSRKKQAEEEARRAEEARLAAEADEARLAEEAEHARMAEEARLAAEAEQARLAEEAERARLAEEARIAEEARLAEEAEAARLADEAEHARMAEEARLAAEAEAEAARLAEEARVAEEARLAGEAEAARLAEEARVAEEARLAEEAEAARQAEEARLAAEAEEARLAEEAEQARLAEEARLAAEAEKARLAAEAEEARAEAERAAEEARLAEEAEAARLAAEFEPMDEPASANDDDAPAAPYRRTETDTAALLRELSSLGLEDDAPSAPVAPARPPSTARTAAAAASKANTKAAGAKAAQKKRKGLFGRG